MKRRRFSLLTKLTRNRGNYPGFALLSTARAIYLSNGRDRPPELFNSSGSVINSRLTNSTTRPSSVNGQTGETTNRTYCLPNQISPVYAAMVLSVVRVNN